MPMIRSTAVLAAAGALAAATGTALAADLPVRTAPPPYVAPLPVFTWTGAYFGVNAGAAFDNETRYNFTDNSGGTTPGTNGVLAGTRPAAFRASDDGFTAGAQLGYNYEFQGFGGFGGAGSGVVIGFETDAAYLDADRTSSYTGTNSNTGGQAITRFRSGIDFLGTVRGRLGYAFNQFLVYGTGGFAYGDTQNRALLYTENNPNLLRYSAGRSGFQTGYAYGGGVEFALPTGSFLNFLKSSAVTVKAEFLRYELDTERFATVQQVSGLSATAGYGIRARTEGDLARIGLNYKF